MRKGEGEEARGVRAVCDVCAAHGHRAFLGFPMRLKEKKTQEFEFTVRQFAI